MRWEIDIISHTLEDKEDKMFFSLRDDGYVHILNVLYEEILENRRLIKGYGEGNFEDNED